MKGLHQIKITITINVKYDIIVINYILELVLLKNVFFINVCLKHVLKGFFRF